MGVTSKYCVSTHNSYTCSYIDLDSGIARVEKYKSVEPAYVDQVHVLSATLEWEIGIEKYVIISRSCYWVVRPERGHCRERISN